MIMIKDNHVDFAGGIENAIKASQKYLTEKNKKLCDNCNKDILSNKLVCSGCYRMRYHNKDCQKNDWSKHVAECLYNK